MAGVFPCYDIHFQQFSGSSVVTVQTDGAGYICAVFADVDGDFIGFDRFHDEQVHIAFDIACQLRDCLFRLGDQRCLFSSLGSIGCCGICSGAASGRRLCLYALSRFETAGS